MLTNLYPPAVSGSSTQSAALARELARRGCKTVIITAKLARDSEDYENVNGVHVYRLPAIILPKTPISLNFPWLNYTLTPKNLKRVEHIISIHNPDVLHLHNHMFDLSFSAVLLGKRTKKPLVITIHTVIKHAQKFYNFILYPADRLFLNYLVIKQADSLICPDVNIEDYVRDAFGTSRAFLVPYGISLPEMPTAASVEKLRAEYQLNGKRVILSLGHVHEIRNRKDLIEALPFVLKELPNTVLLIVGTVADVSPAALARRLGVHESVVFTSYVPHSQVPAFLSLADLEAHWLNQEAARKTSLGIASLEAMASGKVVIAAANENTYGQGVLRAGENVVLVEPGNPRQLAQTIVGLLGDSERRRVIGERARQTIEKHFSWDSVCSRTLDVYREALRRSAHPG
jgi:glycosyltransferase involved in cell wall biosynthesis